MGVKFSGSVIVPAGAGGFKTKLIPSSDPNFASVVLLLHFNGTNGSTTFTDSSNSNHTMSVTGNAQITTSDSQFGGASGTFDGSSDYLTAPQSADFLFGADDFTMECWAKTSKATQGLFGNWNSTGNGAGWTFQIISGKLRFLRGNNVVNAVGTTTVNDDVWHHLAVSRASGLMYGYVDGNEEFAGEGNYAVSLGSSTTPQLEVGKYPGASGTLHYQGLLDDLRITNGVARYTAPFTPPSSEFLDQ